MTGGVRENVTLASNVAAAGSYPTTPAIVYGGDYVFSVAGTGTFSAQLQALSPDGVTYQNLGPAKTASDTGGGTGVGLGSNARVRVTVTGTPTALFATLSRLP